MTLLPPNATPLEHGLEHGVARLSVVPVPLRQLWDPATCPLELLPYLAWALSIDGWSTDWPEAVKRSRVASALAIQRSKGTASSVRSVVASFGGSVALKEWWQTSPRGAPHTFELVLDVDGIVSSERSAAFVDAVIAEVWRAKPVRSTFTFTQALTAIGSIGPIAAARPVTYARLQLAA